MCVFYLLPHEIIEYCSQLERLEPKRAESVEGSSECGSSGFLSLSLASCCKCEKSKVALGQCKRTVIPIYSGRGGEFLISGSALSVAGDKKYTHAAPLNCTPYILKPEVGLMHVVKTTASFFSSSDTSLVLYQKCALAL